MGACKVPEKPSAECRFDTERDDIETRFEM